MTHKTKRKLTPPKDMSSLRKKHFNEITKAMPWLVQSDIFHIQSYIANMLHYEECMDRYEHFKNSDAKDANSMSWKFHRLALDCRNKADTIVEKLGGSLPSRQKFQGMMDEAKQEPEDEADEFFSDE